jgi:membrane protease YdiL (CAAX protease family)
MKSAAISSLILSVLIGLLMIASSMLLFNPEWGLRFSTISIMVAFFLSGFGINRHPMILLGKEIWSIRKDKRSILWISLALGGVLAILDRYLEGMPLLPVSLGWFVLVSMLIGATEEFMFRGVILGEASRWHPTGAVFLSALCFAAYKAMLFVHPERFNTTDPWMMFYLTLPAGILLGYARKSSGSIWPPILAHMLFDLILYGDALKTPWWVW